MPKEFSCVTCGQSYESSGGLRKHYRKFQEHKAKVVDNGPPPAPKAVSTFLNVSDVHRKARLKELAKQLTYNEMQEIFLPKLSHSVSLAQLAVEKSKCSVRNNNISVVKLWTELQNCVFALKKKHPELELNFDNKQGTNTCKLSSFIDDYQYNNKTELNTPKLVLGKEHYKDITDFVVNNNNSEILKNVIMPAVLERNHENFDISQAKYQNILRNELGKELNTLNT